MLLFSATVRGGCILLGMFSLFGSLFVGTLYPSTLAGLLGLAAALVPARSRNATNVILALVVAGLLSQVLDIAYYYWMLDIPGNDYPWPLSTTYLVVLVAMGLYAIIARAQSRNA